MNFNDVGPCVGLATQCRDAPALTFTRRCYVTPGRTLCRVAYTTSLVTISQTTETMRHDDNMSSGYNTNAAHEGCISLATECQYDMSRALTAVTSPTRDNLVVLWYADDCI